MAGKKLSRKEKQRAQAAQQKKSEASVKIVSGREKLARQLALVAAVVGFLLYANTLNHEYALDDYSVIKENRLTRQGWDAFPEILSKSYRFGYYFTSDELYRPLPKAMFAAEWALFPDQPAAGHWVNVILYALTGFLLFMVLYRYSKGKHALAFIVSLLFIAHPLHTEVVANIKSRDEILSLLFILLALQAVYRYAADGRAKWLLAAMGSYLLSLLSKESGITFLAVLPLWLYFFSTGTGAARLRATGALGIAAALFLLIRQGVLSVNMKTNFSVADNLLMNIHDAGQRFATAVHILGIYLKQLVFPHPLVFDKSYNEIEAVGLGDPGFLVPMAILLAMGAVAIIRFRKREFPVLGAWYFLLTLSIFSNVIIVIGTTYGERLLYLPSLGFAMALGYLICRTGRGDGKAGSWPAFLKANTTALVLCGVVTAAYGAKTVSRNVVWKNNWTLFTNDVKLAPNSTRTHYYLGNYMTRPENIGVDPADTARMHAVLDSGIVELKRAVEIFPGFCDVYKQLGVAYGKKGESRTAFDYYKQAIECNPTDAPAHSNIGTIYFELGEYQQALNAFKKAVQLDPNYTEALVNLGSSYGMLQQYDQALHYLHKCIRTDPGYTEAYFFLGITYRFKGDQQNAEQYMQKYRELGGQRTGP